MIHSFSCGQGVARKLFERGEELHTDNTDEQVRQLQVSAFWHTLAWSALVVMRTVIFAGRLCRYAWLDTPTASRRHSIWKMMQFYKAMPDRTFPLLHLAAPTGG